MQFDLNGMNYAFEMATGDFGAVEPGEQLDQTNPPLRPKALTGGRLQQLTLEVTQDCNLRCAYCFHTHQGIPGVRPHRSVYMPNEVAILAMQEVERRGADDIVICFYGGEPLLNFPLIVAVVEEWPQYHYAIDTNGQAVDGHIARWAARHNIDWQISVDGLGQANDRYRGQGSFARVENAIYQIQRHKPEASIRLALTLAPPWRIGDAAALVEKYRDLPFTVSFANLTGGSIEPEYLDLTPYREIYTRLSKAGRRDEIPRLIREIFDVRLILFFHRKKNKRFDKWSPGRCCNPGVRRLHVSATGQYSACEKTGDAHQIGDVGSGIDWPAIEAMHKEFYVERQALGCADCEILRLCGGCWAEPVDCARQKEFWLSTMKLFAELGEADALFWLKETELS